MNCFVGECNLFLCSVLINAKKYILRFRWLKWMRISGILCA